jgi:hypothetical protein
MFGNKKLLLKEKSLKRVLQKIFLLKKKLQQNKTYQMGLLQMTKVFSHLILKIGKTFG